VNDPASAAPRAQKGKGGMDDVGPRVPSLQERGAFADREEQTWMLEKFFALEGSTSAGSLLSKGAGLQEKGVRL